MDSEKLDALAPVLDALRSLANRPETYRMSLEDADLQFRDLLDAQFNAQDSHASGIELVSSNSSQNAKPTFYLPPKATTAEILRRISRLLKLSPAKAKLLKDVNVVGRDHQGSPCLYLDRSRVLPRPLAMCFLTILGCVGALAIATVLGEPDQSPWIWARALVLGHAIGATAGLVLGHSFRIYPLIGRLKEIQPWLLALHPQQRNCT
jgi:hypothetical protein